MSLERNFNGWIVLGLNVRVVNCAGVKCLEVINMCGEKPLGWSVLGLKTHGVKCTGVKCPVEDMSVGWIVHGMKWTEVNQPWVLNVSGTNTLSWYACDQKCLWFEMYTGLMSWGETSLESLILGWIVPYVVVHGVKCTGVNFHGLISLWSELSMGLIVPGLTVHGVKCVWAEMPMGWKEHGLIGLAWLVFGVKCPCGETYRG